MVERRPPTAGGGRVRRVLLACVVAASLGPRPSLAAEDLASLARQVEAHPDVTYRAAFTWPCRWVTWERMLAEPVLMGRLWRALGYEPAYDFSARGDTLHVVDPTGLVGDALPVMTAPGACTWWVDGRLNHWAVPVLNSGQAVFVVRSRQVDGGVAVDLVVTVRAGSPLGNAVLRLARPLLAGHVQRRIDRNLRDGRRIAELVETAPDSALRLLDGGDAERFRRAFGPWRP